MKVLATVVVFGDLTDEAISNLISQLRKEENNYTSTGRMISGVIEFLMKRPVATAILKQMLNKLIEKYCLEEIRRDPEFKNHFNKLEVRMETLSIT